MDPCCMSCKAEWRRDFLVDVFPKSFIIKDLKCHREKIVLDREKSLLPETLPEVEKEMRRRNRMARIQEIMAIVKRHYTEIGWHERNLEDYLCCESKLKRAHFNEVVTVLHSLKKELRTRKNDLETIYYSLPQTLRDFVAKQDMEYETIARTMKEKEADDEEDKEDEEGEEAAEDESKEEDNESKNEKEAEGKEDEEAEDEEATVSVEVCHQTEDINQMKKYYKQRRRVRSCERQIQKVHDKSDEMDATMNELRKTDCYVKSRSEIARLRREIRENLAQVDHIKEEEILMEEGIEVEATAATTRVQRFVRACPKNDCRGFLSTQFICGLCNSHVCRECHELYENKEEHICKPENVESAALVKVNTKPCPKCASLIFKIEGCDQMFCTQCKTPFSWKTGVIITHSKIHNPHYFDWVKVGNHQINDCGPRHGIKWLKAEDGPIRDDINGLWSHICDIVRMINSIRDETMRTYRMDYVQDNVDLRVRYLLHEIDEAEWRRSLHRREKAANKKREFYAIFDAFVRVVGDILQAVENSTTYTEANETIKQYYYYLDLFHASMEKASDTFQCCYRYRISNEFKLEKIYTKKTVTVVS
jgi:chemotaxis protein histidine kinase CheA